MILYIIVEMLLKIFVVIILIVLLFNIIKKLKHRPLIQNKKNKLKSIYQNEPVFLCDDMEVLDDNLV
jgi:uncharacterized membrane protein